jgi:hypothetical protein
VNVTVFNAVVVVNGKFERMVSQYVDGVFNEYPKEFVDSVMKPLQEIVPLQTQYIRALSSSLMLRVSPRNSDALETFSI